MRKDWTYDVVLLAGFVLGLYVGASVTILAFVAF
jgi:hypothetical protein